MLSHREPFFRESAVRNIDQWATLDMVPRLVTSLEDNSPVVRAAVIRTLGRLKAADTFEPVARRLTNDADRPLAIEALKQISPHAFDTVIAYLDGDSVPLRHAACALVSNIDLEPQKTWAILHKLAARLGDDETSTHVAARTIRRLLGTLVKTEAESRPDAPLVPERLTQIILRGMDSASPAGRAWAIRLAMAAGPQAQDMTRRVAEALKDESPVVRRIAAAALPQMTRTPGPTKPSRLPTPETDTMPEVPVKLPAAFEQLMTDPDPAVRFWSARLTCELGAAAKPVLPMLLKLCQDAQPAVRWAAVESVQGVCDALCGVRLGHLEELQAVAQQINALSGGAEEQVSGYSPELLKPLRRIWPVEAAASEAFGNRRRQSTTGPDSADWFGYGGAGDWKVFAVEPKRPLLLRTRGDGQMIRDIRFTISEYDGGRWVVKETIHGPGNFNGFRWYFYTPSSDRIRLDAQGWFYVFAYQL